MRLALRQKNTTSNVAEDEKRICRREGKWSDQRVKNGIYHLPGTRGYEQTTNPKEWFKTIAEAKAAGYRVHQNKKP